MRSGAPRTASAATEPANMPNSKPRSAAMRAETASCTEAGCTHAPPARISRNRVRRTLQRDGISPSLMLLEVSGLCTSRRSVALASRGYSASWKTRRIIKYKRSCDPTCTCGWLPGSAFSGVDGWQEEPWCRPLLVTNLASSAEDQHPIEPHRELEK